MKVVTVQLDVGGEWLTRSYSYAEDLDEAYARVTRAVAFNSRLGYGTEWYIYNERGAVVANGSSE